MVQDTYSTLNTVLNFRDVGRSTSAIRSDMLFRSGHLDNVGPQENAILRDEYGIKSIVDLRGIAYLTTGRTRRPWPLIIGEDGSPKLLYPDRIAHQDILGLKRHYIDICSPKFLEHQRSKLSWFEKASSTTRIMLSPGEGMKHYVKMLSRKTCKERMDGTKDAIDLSGPQIRAIFQVFADVNAYPIVILDEFGKANINVIICLLLLFLGVDKSTIQWEYMLSDQYLISTREERLKRNRELGFPDQWVDGNPDFVQTMDEYMWFRHGGVEEYLRSIGLTERELDDLKSILGTKKEFSEKKDLLF